MTSPPLNLEDLKLPARRVRETREIREKAQLRWQTTCNAIGTRLEAYSELLSVQDVSRHDPELALLLRSRDRREHMYWQCKAAEDEALHEYRARVGTLVIFYPNDDVPQFWADVTSMWMENGGLHAKAVIPTNQVGQLGPGSRWELYGRDGELAYRDVGLTTDHGMKSGVAWEMIVHPVLHTLRTSASGWVGEELHPRESPAAVA